MAVDIVIKPVDFFGVPFFLLGAGLDQARNKTLSWHSLGVKLTNHIHT
jgi:hypothetical protein